MLYEFALDPSVLSDWQSVRFFLDRFGVEYGRMISRFPKKWMRMVYEAAADCGDVELKRIEARLQMLKENQDRVFLNSDRLYEPQLEWILNAEAANAGRPFHAIISTCNPRDCPTVLIAEDVYDGNALFKTDREIYVSSTAQDMAKAIAPMLLAAKEIVFIDRHFDAEQDRFLKPLKEFVKAAVSAETTRIEYHLRGDLKDSPYAEEFEEYCKNNIPELLPKGVQIRLIRWQQRYRGQGFHARFVLTEIGGIQFDPGLDEGKPGEQTKLNLLTDLAYLAEWEKFRFDGIDPAKTTYDLMDQVLIVGTG